MRAVATRAWAQTRRRLAQGLALVLVSGAVAMPKLAWACAVCTAGRDDESNAAFLISTIFLSLLPLAALGTLVFVLWRRIRALETESNGAEALRSPGASAAPVTPAH